MGNAGCVYLAIQSQKTGYGVVGIVLGPGENVIPFENSLVLSILLECAAK